MTDKVCFIIMPITTPSEFISSYKDDCEHFLHVMQCLFKPAIEKSGFKPILPVTQGSEIIHGEIISKIESSDLVLCDMSILNPNVFFELGIRTALNKPVCLIKDNVVEKVPFDTGIINYHVYSSDLSSWIVKNEIEKLAQHISESFTKSNDCNSLWKYFSLKSIATPPEKLGGDSEKIEYLTMQVDAIRRQLNESSEKKSDESAIFFTKRPNKQLCEEETDLEIPHELKKIKYLIADIKNLLLKYQINENDINIRFQKNLKGDSILVIPSGKLKNLPMEAFKELDNLSAFYGIKLRVED